MKRTILFLLLITINFNYAQTNTEFEKNQVIIELKDFDHNKIALSNNQFGILLLDNLNVFQKLNRIEAIGNYKITKTFLLTFDENKDVEQLCKEYLKLQCIAHAEPNYIATAGGMEQNSEMATVPVDTYFNRQWGLFNNGTLSGVGTIENDADVDMELAWDIQTGDPNMIIAVPDSGLRMSHPEIASRIWINPSEIAGNGIDDDGNGLIDDINGWDWVNNDNNPTDDHGHGTNVCGIIGAIPNNNSLYSGVNWNSKIMPLKVLNSSNSGSYAGMANSIYYAVDHGAKVISMSIGGSSASSTIGNAVSYANTHNVVFVACMMNNNNNITYYPAGYSTTYNNVIAVGSTNPNDDRTAPFFWSQTSGSSFGNHINVVAPGNYIYGLTSTSDTTTNYWGGTSQATPLVAGVASLMLAQNPNLTPSQVRTILQNTAEDQKGLPAEDVAGFDIYHGWGRINAHQALQQTLNNQEFESFQQEFYVVNPVLNKNIELWNKGNYMDNFQVKLFSLDGKLLVNTEINVNTTKNEIKFDNPAGIYILQIDNEKYRKTFKITMQ